MYKKYIKTNINTQNNNHPIQYSFVGRFKILFINGNDKSKQLYLCI